MLRISFTLFLATVTWIRPITAVSAFAEPPLENPQFINYEKFHKPILGSDKQPAVVKTKAVKSNSISKPSSRISNENSYSGRNYSREEVQDLIKSYSAQYGISAEAPLCIAKHESGFNQFSKNRNSTASGVFQYISGTWKATDEGLAGLSVFDAEANVRAAIKFMSSRLNAKPWTVAKSCPPIKTIN